VRLRTQRRTSFFLLSSLSSGRRLVLKRTTVAKIFFWCLREFFLNFFLCLLPFWGERRASVGTNREIQNTKRFGERERRRRGLRSHSPLFARVPFFFFFSISSHLLSPFFSRACRGKFQETNRERGASVRFSTARIFLLLSLSLSSVPLSLLLSLSLLPCCCCFGVLVS